MRLQTMKAPLALKDENLGGFFNFNLFEMVSRCPKLVFCAKKMMAEPFDNMKTGKKWAKT